MTMPLLLGLLLALLLPAVATDVRARRIPNLLCLAGIVAGIAANTWFLAFDGTLLAVKGLLLAFAIALPFWLLGWLGAGDVKLLAAVGAITGPQLALYALAGTAFAGFFLAVGALLHRRLLASTFERLAASFSLSVAGRRMTYVQPREAEAETRLPYAIAIAIGSIAAVLLYGG